MQDIDNITLTQVWDKPPYGDGDIWGYTNKTMGDIGVYCPSVFMERYGMNQLYSQEYVLKYYFTFFHT